MDGYLLYYQVIGCPRMLVRISLDDPQDIHGCLQCIQDICSHKRLIKLLCP